MLTLGRASGGKGQSSAQGNIRLRDWSERKDRNGARRPLSTGRIRLFFNHQCPDIRIRAPGDPFARQRHGFDFELQDQAGLGHEALIAARDQLMDLARRSSAAERPDVRAGRQPQLEVVIDRKRPGRSGCPSTPSTRIFPPRGAGSTSTTSWIAAASKKSVRTGRCAVPHEARRFQ